MEEGLAGYLPGISVVATRCEVADHGTVDCAYFCRCDDGSDYAVKDRLHNPDLPHQEWFCTRLGEVVGLASPPIRIVQVGADETFGSRWESGMETADWWVRAQSGEIDFSLLRPSISRILAFDLFAHNVDRHLTNYIVRKQRTGHAILAFDYSQAWLFSGFPLPELPLADTTKTMLAFRFLRRLFGDFIIQKEVKYVCDQLRSVKTEQIERIIMEHPNNW